MMAYVPLNLDEKSRMEVNKETAEELVDTFERHLDWYEEQAMIGVTEPEGRRLLQFYEAQGLDYWQKLNQEFPDQAKKNAREFYGLARRYRGI
jgi:hypothetical protein